MNTKELVLKLGGPTKVSQKIRIRPQAVSLWVAKNRVPLDRVPSILRLAKEAGLTITPADIRGDIDWAGLS